MKPVVHFSDKDSEDATQVGGKGANLGILTRAGFPVPAGFSVTTRAYTDFLAAHGLAETIQSIVGEIDFADATAVEKRAAEIRVLIETEALPAALAEDIAAQYASLGSDVLVAVRSSGTAEDLEGASFAGQHDTYLHIRGSEDVIDAVKRCWASLWTARATAYRQHKGFGQGEVGIAVVVQTMVASEVSGVMFTANPIAALTDEIGINASWGLGEAVVSGMVTPDSYTIDVDTLAIKEKNLGTKEQRIRLDDAAGKGTVHEETPAAHQARFALTDAQVAELADLGRRVTAHYDGIPQDIEWGLHDGRFYLLQSRPVTGAVLAWDEDLDDWQTGPDDPTTVWSRVPSDDVWTGAVTPLFYTIRGHALYDFHVLGNNLYGMPEIARRRWFKYYRGTAYWNTEPDTAWVSRLAPKSVRPALLANTDPLRHEEILSAPNNYFALAKVMLRVHALDPAQGITKWVKVQENYIHNRRDEAAGLSDEDARKLSDQALIRYCEERVKFERVYLEDLGVGYYLHFMSAATLLSQMVIRWYKGSQPNVLMDLLTGTEQPTGTSIVNLKLWEMSRDIYDSPELRELFESSPGREFFDRLETCEAGKAFKAKYDVFAAEHGPRGHEDRDIYFTRRAEDPGVDYRMLAAFLAVDPDHDPAKLEEAARQRKQAAYEEIHANLRTQPFGSMRAEIFRIVNAYNQKLLMDRDNQRDFVDISTFAIKRAFLELNRRLMERGVFEDDRDFYFLSRRELYDVFQGRANMRLVRAKIAGRRHNFDLVLRREVTNPVYLRDSRELHIDDGGDSDGQLRGMPTSGGVVTGVARVVKSLDEIGRVKQGEIMVCNSTDPGWTPVFLLLAGAVFETGGAFAHCSCISREYGIPAIQIPGALNKIPDGAVITVDGNTGAITIHDDADATPVDASCAVA